MKHEFIVLSPSPAPLGHLKLLSLAFTLSSQTFGSNYQGGGVSSENKPRDIPVKVFGEESMQQVRYDCTSPILNLK